MSDDKPIRVQRKRTKGWRMPENTIIVDRSTRWGNPFRVRYDPFLKQWEVRHEGNLLSIHPSQYEAHLEAVRMFEMWFDSSIAQIGTAMYDFRRQFGWGGFSLAQVVNVLRGKNLADWCALDMPCHADVLLRLANPERKP